MERDLTITEAARTLAEVVQRVRGGESARLLENGEAVARIVPVTQAKICKTGLELARWWKDPARARLTPEDTEAFEADLKAAHETLLPPKEEPWE